MSKVCAICGKHAVAGRSISHSHRVTNRKFRPNIQHVTCVVDGHKKKLKRLLHLPEVRQGRPLLAADPLTHRANSESPSGGSFL